MKDDIRNEILKDVSVNTLDAIILSTEYDDLSKFIKAKYEANKITKEFYKNELYRKLNWRTKTYRQKSEDKYLNNIKDTYGNKDDTLICIGDWSNKNTIKGLASTMGI